MKQGGVCWIMFKDGLSDEEIQDIIANIHIQNEKYFDGMFFSQIESVEEMFRGKGKADEYWIKPIVEDAKKEK